jgi:diaminohydroxyphosphoribosylaminopyrimidine deaminase/5-amino-6-(5-phosphoribosylamino)uracil reductase
MSVDRATDERFMRLALDEADKGSPSPNPHVGAVIVGVVDGAPRVLGKGFHRRSGEAHAEVAAIRDATSNAIAPIEGATMYVTLEPHDHHGRTPPCTEAILAAKIARVVVGVRDPNPRVFGRGIEHLRAAGVEVVEGIASDACAARIASFARHCTTGMPYVRVKIASSLDGRIAAPMLPHRADATEATPRAWLTGPASRTLVHAMRAASDAVATGVGTVLDDDPALTVRDVPPIEARNAPVRVVFDTFARSPIRAKVIATARDVPTWLLCAEDAPAEKVAALEVAGVRVIRSARGEAGSLDVRAAAESLGRAGIVDLMIEAGGRLVGAFVAADLVDEMSIFLAPIVLGASGASSIVGPTPASPETASRFALRAVERVGDDDVLVRYARAARSLKGP